MGDRLKQAIYEHPSTAARSPFPNGEGKEEAASPPQKDANPTSLRSAAPSFGRGSRGHSLLPMKGGAPKGRRLDGGIGMKKIGKDRHKCVVYESTLSTADAVPLPQWGRQRGGGFAPKGSQPRLAALGSPFQGKGLAWTLPPSYGRRCPEGAEVGWGKRDEKDRERSSQVRHLRECRCPRYKAFPSRGRCPEGADRVLAV